MARNVPHNPLEGPKPELQIDLRGGSQDNISIIVVHNDRPEYLNLCMQSIEVTSVNDNYEVIVVDNDSGEESQDYLNAIEDMGNKVVRCKRNLYWSAAANKGVEAADRNSKYYVFLHHDVVITSPSWLDIMVSSSQAGDAGMVGTQSSHYEIDKQPINFIQEWCMLISKECWKDIGPWPEKLPQIGHSFIMTMRAQLKGHKPKVIKHPIASHYGVFNLDINEYERMVEQAPRAISELIREIQS